MKLTDINRICKEHTECRECPLHGVCDDFVTELWDDDELQKIEAECDKWLAEHPEKPKKTRQSEFLKLFPKAEIWKGAINICPSKMGAEVAGCDDDDSCTECKRRYWLEEIEDDEE